MRGLEGICAGTQVGHAPGIRQVAVQAKRARRSQRQGLREQKPEERIEEKEREPVQMPLFDMGA